MNVLDFFYFPFFDILTVLTFVSDLLNSLENV